MKTLRPILVALLLIVSVTSRADEGMWLLPLLQQMNAKAMADLGCRLTPEQIYSINNSSLKDAIVHFHLKDWTITDQPTAISDLKRTGKHFANAIINRGALALRNWWDNVDPAQKNLYVNLETSDPQNVIPPHELMKMLSDELRNW